MSARVFAVDLCRILPLLPEAQTFMWSCLFEKYQPHLDIISELLYEKLQAVDRERFIAWFLKRWAKIDVLNSVEAGLYRNRIKMVSKEEREEVELHGRTYKLRDFSSQGHDFKLLGYDWFLGVHDIYYNQYEEGACTLEPGDVIIDAGSFIGDTAVFFHHKLQGDCEIHCFELLDENLQLMLYNLQANGMETAKIHLNKFALTDQTGDFIHVKPGQTQGSTSMFGKDSGQDCVETITLDDYVQMMNLTRVDFIKMDIEGAEMPALRGAMATIRHFKPRLALCLYHRWDDVLTIPKFLQETGVDYDFRFKWVQLADGWEAVLLAQPCTELRIEPVCRPDMATEVEGLASALARLNASYLKKMRTPQAAASRPVAVAGL